MFGRFNRCANRCDAALLRVALLLLANLAFCAPSLGAVAYVQGNYAVPQTPQSTVNAAYTAIQTAGNLNVVVVGWSDSTAHVQSVSDTSGNVYALAVGPTVQTGVATQAIYYAAGIVGAGTGANLVQVQFDAAARYVDLRIAEYNGIDAVDPVDAVAAAMGRSALSDSGVTTTSTANTLLVGANLVQSGTAGPGPGYTSRMITWPDSDILEDQVVSAAGSYSAIAPLKSSHDWIMQLVAFRAASDDGADTQPPTAPGSLSATGVSSSQIDLTWAASTDNVGVTSYLIERCQGTGCTSFAQIGATTGTTYSSAGLAASTSYSFRVRATDAATNLSGYSNVASATTAGASDPPPTPPAAPIAYVQGSYAVPQTPQIAVTGAYTAAQTTGNLNVVVVGWSDSTAHIQSVTDSRGNAYALAVGPTVQPGVATQAIYYAAGIGAAGAGNNAVTVQFDVPARYVDLRIAEYSGIDTVDPVDAGAEGMGRSALSDSGSAVTTNANNLLVGANLVQSGTAGPGPGYTSRMITNPDSDILQDRIVSATGSYSATAPLTSSRDWIMQMVAFRAAPGGGGPDTQAPTAPGALNAAATSGTQINLTWSASTDNVAVTNYPIERCQGAGCTNFAQIATTFGTAYSNTGLTASTAYSYRVRATDAANNLGDYSNVASATTQQGSSQPPATVSYIQHNSAVPQTPQASVSLVYASDQTAGNLNVVAVGWSDSVAQVQSVTDTFGNAYMRAVGPTVYPARATQSIYYAAGIAAASGGANVVTVQFSAPVPYPDIRILEYSGIDATNPVDVVAAATGDTALSSSGAVTTTHARDLLVAANLVHTATVSAGPGFTKRVITVPDGDIVEDRSVDVAGSYTATAPLTRSGPWIMQMVAFRASAAPPADVTAPAIAITSPEPGATVSGVVTLTASASDADSAVGGVQFQIDGVNVGPVDTSPPYQLSYDTAQFGNGTHLIGAYAWDSRRNLGEAAPVAVMFSNGNAGNPAQTGLWSGVFQWPLVAIHSLLLSDGRVLMWDQLAYGLADATVWDPVTSSFSPAPMNDGYNIFCAGHVNLGDGRTFVAGGHAAAHIGLPIGRIFDPRAGTWTTTPDMAYDRWYPTLTALADGRVLVLSGEMNCKACYAPVPEIYDAQTNAWTQLSGASLAMSYYPHVFLLPDGGILTTGSAEDPVATQRLDIATQAWSVVDSRVLEGGSSAMYLPGRILKSGSSADPDRVATPTVDSTYVMDATQSAPAWRQVGSMQYPRAYHTLTLLPDGDVLVTGGGRTTGFADLPNAVYAAEVWSPQMETWTTLSAMQSPRLYHGTSLLLPDGRVLVAGGGRGFGRTDASDQENAEIFAPPYLFKGPRPVIAAVPSELDHGQTFSVQTPDAARIARVALIRNGSVTHAIDSSQRYVPLSFTAGAGTLSVTAPANANLAPPGHYMLFIVDTDGVPSVSAQVRF